jgi:CTP synthase (UTP-ammonia lyase)
MTGNLTVAVIGDYDPAFAPHRATDEAIGHAACRLGAEVEVRWCATEPLESDIGAVEEADAVWCAPGSPYRSLSGALRALRHVREQRVPALGTCGGFQHIVIEYARHVLGLTTPHTRSTTPTRRGCSCRNCHVPWRAGPCPSNCGRGRGPRSCTRRRGCTSSTTATSGSTRNTSNARVLELADHPFYLATLFVPQTRSTPEQPHPLIVGWLRAALTTRLVPTPDLREASTCDVRSAADRAGPGPHRRHDPSG